MSKVSDLVVGLVIFALGMPWLNMWVGKSVWWETLSFPFMIDLYNATVAAFQKMKRIHNRAKLLDGRHHICTVLVSSSVTHIPSILHSFAVEGVLKFRVSSIFGIIYLL